MKLTFRPLQGPARAFAAPPAGSSAADVGGACPHCGTMPLRARGVGPQILGDRRYESAAHCADCDAHVGTLVATPATLFGIREDRAVIEHGRARIYGR